MEHKQGKTVRNEAHNIIWRVIKKCDEEAQKGILLHRIPQATLRASDYVGISTKTICRIRKEDSMSKEDEPLRSPGKKRPKREETKINCSLEEQAIIRNLIYDLYTEKKSVPTAPELLAATQEKMYFPWSIRSFYRLLGQMGFKWKKTNKCRKVLIEKPDVIAWRAKYLNAIQYFRNENRSIIYIDETCVDDTLTFHKCWENEEGLNVPKVASPSHRLIVIHAGGKNGWIKGAELIFKSRTTSGDFHKQITAVDFENWIYEKLLPNIPPNSVIVMDNAPYRSVELNAPPSKYAKKQEMVKWMVENNVAHATNLRKYELYELIEQFKQPVKKYKIDGILRLYGHSTLRLLPHMCGLNPIELAWAQVKMILREKNTCYPVLSSDDLEEYTMEAINIVTESDWQNFCAQVEEIEREYYRKDGLMEDVIDNLGLQTDESESDSDESTDFEDSDE